MNNKIGYVVLILGNQQTVPVCSCVQEDSSDLTAGGSQEPKVGDSRTVFCVLPFFFLNLNIFCDYLHFF